MGDIGRERREVEFEPLTRPAAPPLTVPAEPVRVPQPAPAPEPAPARTSA